MIIESNLSLFNNIIQLLSINKQNSNNFYEKLVIYVIFDFEIAPNRNQKNQLLQNKYQNEKKYQRKTSNQKRRMEK